MRFRIRAMAAAALVLCAPAMGGPHDAAVRKELEAAYNKMALAMKNKDIEGVLKLGTDDFTMQMQGRPPQSAEQIKSGMQGQFAMMKSVKQVKMGIKSLKVTGSTAIVNSYARFVAEMAGPNGTTSKFTDDSTARDTWVKTSQGWKCKTVQIITDRMTMNGKPFDPMKGMAPSTSGRKPH